MPPMYIDGRVPVSVTSLNASVSVQTPYLQEGSGTKSLAVPAPAANDTLAVLTATQTLAAKTLVNPVIQGGSVNAATLTQPVITSGTLTSPSITGGNWNGGTLTQPVITTATLSSPTIQSPAMTGGTWSSATLTSPTLVGPTITGAGASTATVVAAAATDALMTPYNTTFHPGVAKAWVKVTMSATSILAAYNVTSVQNGGTGIYDICFSSPFANTAYIILANGSKDDGSLVLGASATHTFTTQTVWLYAGGAKADEPFAAVIFGTE